MIHSTATELTPKLHLLYSLMISNTDNQEESINEKKTTSKEISGFLMCVIKVPLVLTCEF